MTLFYFIVWKLRKFETDMIMMPPFFLNKLFSFGTDNHYKSLQEFSKSTIFFLELWKLANKSTESIISALSKIKI